MAELILKDESYKLIGLMFKVHNQLGSSCKEKNYQNAIERILQLEKIPYEREKEVHISFEGERLGNFFADFIVDNKIILEIKTKPYISNEDVRQVIRYLKATNLPLAIIVNFRRQSLEYKRVINPDSPIIKQKRTNQSSLEKISHKLDRYLGIDYGEKKIGLALGDSETKVAIPFKVARHISKISEVVDGEQIDKIVIGKPFKMRGKEEDAAKDYLNFLNNLKKEVKIPIIEIDERLTSKAADALSGSKKTKAPQDAVAAMLILQSYLDARHE